jgi:phospholipid/cholesterol/gamma-HCH transport system substrate-binding protein
VRVTKEFKVGLLAIVSMVLLYFGFNFLKGIDLFKKTKSYYALYKNIDGLTISNPVIINGLSVGRVSQIGILQQKGNVVAVEMTISSKIRLAKGTVARLVNTDFLGSKAIELKLTDNDSFFMDGDTLRSDVDEGIAEFLKQSAGPVADNLGTTIARFNEILGNFQGNSENINEILDHLKGISAKLDQQLPEMQEKTIVLMDGLSRNSRELSDLMQRLKPIMADVNQITDSVKTLELSQTLTKTQQMLDNLNASLEQLKTGEGTMGKLMYDDSLYIYLSHTARDLDRLLVDLEARPGRYVQFSVFGKKDRYEKQARKEEKRARKAAEKEARNTEKPPN